MKHLDPHAVKRIEHALGKMSETPACRRIEIDLERYQHHLDDPSLTPEQRDEVLSALWFIVSSFVELGFEIHPLQQACGQPEFPLDRSGNPESDEVRSIEKTQSEERGDAPEP